MTSTRVTKRKPRFRRKILPSALSVCIVTLAATFHPSNSSASDVPYLEPGTLRLSHSLSLEGVWHGPRRGQIVEESGLEKNFTVDPSARESWNSDWGMNFLTEAAARIDKDISARTLFELQGAYADRYWRPLNINHHMDQESHTFLLREAEARIDKKAWYLHGFSGVSHNGWREKGDLFGFYSGVYPLRDYLGSSGIFGVYPQEWRQNQYLNIAQSRVPTGGEAGGRRGRTEAAVAYGSELQWGYDASVFGRVRHDMGTSQFNFLVKNEDVPYDYIHREDERLEAYALTWTKPSEEALAWEAGVLYQPFRAGQSYKVARKSSGVLPWTFADRTLKKEDGLGGILRLDGYVPLGGLIFSTVLDGQYAGLSAGNKKEIGLQIGTDITPLIRGTVEGRHRKPVEGPLPFLYEGTPDNIGAIVSSPRGPESPFTVDWTNREASFLTTTLHFDPTPGTRMFLYNPTDVAGWNLNPEEDAPVSMAVQYRLSDYKTPTDRQTYYDEQGTIVWESAGQSGAWASRYPLSDVRVLGQGKIKNTGWMLGVAGGQAPAFLGVAYTTSTARAKPITEYFSVEARLDFGRFLTWGHYGSGVWGPEENLHPFFGETFHRLFGAGVRYNVTRHTTWDLSYLGARQKEGEFRPAGLGAFDEIRSVLSHRFGFLLEFQKPSRPGTRVP